MTSHTDRIAAERARKQRERADRHAKGYVWRGLWVLDEPPDVWARVKRYADRLNAAAEKERK